MKFRTRSFFIVALCGLLEKSNLKSRHKFQAIKSIRHAFHLPDPVRTGWPGSEELKVCPSWCPYRSQISDLEQIERYPVETTGADIRWRWKGDTHENNATYLPSAGMNMYWCSFFPFLFEWVPKWKYASILSFGLWLCWLWPYHERDRHHVHAGLGNGTWGRFCGKTRVSYKYNSKDRNTAIVKLCQKNLAVLI